MSNNVRLTRGATAKIEKSAETVAHVRGIAEKITAAAGPGMVAGVDVYSDGIRGYVVTATPQAMNGEVKDRRLTRAVDAGRG